MSRQRIPHLLTHLLTESDGDAFRNALLDRAGATTGPACTSLLDAVMLFDKHRSESFQRRA